MLTHSKRISFLFLGLAVLILAACAPQGGQLPGTGSDDPQVIETPAGSPTLPPKAVLDAQSWLAGRLNVSPQQIEIGEIEQAEWSDSCLGLGQANESCAAVMTPGWRAVFTVNGETYEVRTDETGSNIRSADISVEMPGATGDETGLEGQQWNLVSFGPEGSETPVAEGSMVTLTLENGQAGGSGGCNSYGTPYQLRGEEITFERVTSTLMACAEEAVTQQEQVYFQALETATLYEVQDNRLVITYDGGVLTFEAAGSAAATPAG